MSTFNNGVLWCFRNNKSSKTVYKKIVINYNFNENSSKANKINLGTLVGPFYIQCVKGPCPSADQSKVNNRSFSPSKFIVAAVESKFRI